MKYLILSLILLSSCTLNQQTRIHEALSNPTGALSHYEDIHFVAESIETDAFSLTLEKGPLFSKGQRSYSTFFLKGESLPLNERFILAQIDRITGKIDPQCEFEVKEEGKLEIYARDGIFQEKEFLFIASEGFKAGYPIEYAIVSKKTYERASLEFMPYPIETTGMGGERIEAVVTHPMGTHFKVRAQGFLPYERLLLVHISGDLNEEIYKVADAAGSFSIGLNPTILGRLGGEARLEILRSEEKEGLLLDYPWGTCLEKKTWKGRALFPMLFVVNRGSEECDPAPLAALFG